MLARPPTPGARMARERAPTISDRFERRGAGAGCEREPGDRVLYPLCR